MTKCSNCFLSMILAMIRSCAVVFMCLNFFQACKIFTLFHLSSLIIYVLISSTCPMCMYPCLYFKLCSHSVMLHVCSDASTSCLLLDGNAFPQPFYFFHHFYFYKNHLFLWSNILHCDGLCRNMKALQ